MERDYSSKCFEKRAQAIHVWVKMWEKIRPTDKKSNVNNALRDIFYSGHRTDI